MNMLLGYTFFWQEGFITSIDKDDDLYGTMHKFISLI